MILPPPSSATTDAKPTTPDAGAQLAVLATNSPQRALWTLIATWRSLKRRRGVDVSYADDLFALPGFGGADGDSTTYIDRLELCREGGEPSVG